MCMPATLAEPYSRAAMAAQTVESMPPLRSTTALWVLFIRVLRFRCHGAGFCCFQGPIHHGGTECTEDFISFGSATFLPLECCANAHLLMRRPAARTRTCALHKPSDSLGLGLPDELVDLQAKADVQAV